VFGFDELVEVLREQAAGSNFSHPTDFGDPDEILASSAIQSTLTTPRAPSPQEVAGGGYLEVQVESESDESSSDDDD
jgi:hypothetical protein